MKRLHTQKGSFIKYLRGSIAQMIFKIKFICKIRNNLLHTFIRQHDEKQQTFNPYIRDFFFSFSTHIIASCEMDLHDFPMDTQQCKLSFGSCEYLFFLILFVVVCFFFVAFILCLVGRSFALTKG